MNPQRVPRWRETFLVLFLTMSLGLAGTLFAWMITGRFFVAMLAVVAGLIVLGFLQYLIWGWPIQRNKAPGQGEWRELSR